MRTGGLGLLLLVLVGFNWAQGNGLVDILEKLAKGDKTVQFHESQAFQTSGLNDRITDVSSSRNTNIDAVPNLIDMNEILPHYDLDMNEILPHYDLDMNEILPHYDLDISQIPIHHFLDQGRRTVYIEKQFLANIIRNQQEKKGLLSKKVASSKNSITEENEPEDFLKPKSYPSDDGILPINQAHKWDPVKWISPVMYKHKQNKSEDEALTSQSLAVNFLVNEHHPGNFTDDIDSLANNSSKKKDSDAHFMNQENENRSSNHSSVELEEGFNNSHSVESKEIDNRLKSRFSSSEEEEEEDPTHLPSISKPFDLEKVEMGPVHHPTESSMEDNDLDDKHEEPSFKSQEPNMFSINIQNKPPLNSRQSFLGPLYKADSTSNNQGSEYGNRRPVSGSFNLLTGPVVKHSSFSSATTNISNHLFGLPYPEANSITPPFPVESNQAGISHVLRNHQVFPNPADNVIDDLNDPYQRHRIEPYHH